MVDEQEYPLALVLPFDSVYTHRNRRRKDIDLELIRLRRNFRVDSQIVSINMFIRGAVLVQSGEETNTGFESQDFFLFDILDPDMFLRGREEISKYVCLLSLSFII